jgi:hypothetical protein
MSFLHGNAKLLQIFRIGRRKNAAPRFNLVNVELVGNVRRKIFQLDLMRWRHSAGSLAVPPHPSLEKLAKGIRRHRNSLSGHRGEFNRWLGPTRPAREPGRKPGSRRDESTLSKKLSSIGRVHARQCTRESSRLGLHSRDELVFEGWALPIFMRGIGRAEIIPLPSFTVMN